MRRFAELVGGDGEVARISHRLDLPRDAGRAFGLDVLAPERRHGLDELSRRIHLDSLILKSAAGMVGTPAIIAPLASSSATQARVTSASIKDAFGFAGMRSSLDLHVTAAQSMIPPRRVRSWLICPGREGEDECHVVAFEAVGGPHLLS